MTLPNFNYIAAKSLVEASELAAAQAGRCVLMAGGTDVILLLKENVLKGVESVIDLKNIPGIDGLEFIEGEGLRVGALTKLYAIQNSPLVREKMPAVADAAHYVASSQIRRKGTMAGNICNASPTADTSPILLAMNSRITVTGPEGSRVVPIDEFWTGFKKINVDKSKGELVTEIFIPELGPGEGSTYFKHSVRKAMDLAIVGVAAWLRMKDGKVEGARIAVGGGDVITVRAKKAEQLLIGSEITDEVLEKVGVQAADEMNPRSSLRASAEYRYDMIRVYTKRALKKALETLKA